MNSDRDKPHLPPIADSHSLITVNRQLDVSDGAPGPYYGGANPETNRKALGKAFNDNSLYTEREYLLLQLNRWEEPGSGGAAAWAHRFLGTFLKSPAFKQGRRIAIDVSAWVLIEGDQDDIDTTAPFLALGEIGVKSKTVATFASEPIIMSPRPFRPAENSNYFVIEFNQTGVLQINDASKPLGLVYGARNMSGGADAATRKHFGWISAYMDVARVDIFNPHSYQAQ